MRAMQHRLRRIEAKLVPAKAVEDWRSLEAAELIRERRRRRLEAAGLPFAELPPLPADYDGPPRGIAETIRAYREQRLSLLGSRQ